MLSVILTGTAYGQQSFNLSGRVFNETGSPAAMVTVSLSGLLTATDENGHYQFRGLKPGTFKLSFSAVGKNSKTVNARVVNKDLKIDVVLSESSHSLKDINVSGLSKEAADAKKVQDNVMPVTVITSKQLENRAGDLNEILSRQAGIQVRQTGGIGSAARISVRGLEGKRVQVFIDGNPLNTPDGSLGINDLPLQIIERIEIYKGAVPAWLGGDGLGSAVNVIIKHREVSYIDATASYQSYNTRNLGLILKKTFDKPGIEVGAGIFEIKSDNDYTMESPYQPGLRIRRDHDKFHSLLGGASVRFHKLWFDEIELETAFMSTDKELQGIQRNIQEVTTKGSMGILALSLKKEGLLDNMLSFRNTTIAGRFDTRFTDTSAYSYHFDGTRSVSIYGKGEIGIGPNRTRTMQDEFRNRFNINYQLNDHFSLNLNNNFRTGSLDPNDDLANQYAGKNLFNWPGSLNSSVTGITLESRLLDSKLLFSAGFKHFYSLVKGYNTNIYVSDQPDRVNNRTSQLGYTTGVRYNITGYLLVKASHERGIRFPVNSELFGDGALITPAVFLKPELSYNNNIGLVYDHIDASQRRLQLELNGFYMNVDNLIQLAGNGLSLGYVNYARAGITGADADLKYDLTRNWYGSFNVTWQRLTDNNRFVPGTQNVVNPTYGLVIPNVPNFFYNWNLEYHKDNLFGRDSKSRLLYDGSYAAAINYGFDISIYDEYKVPSYFIHTLSAEQSFKNNRYTLTAEVNNLLDAAVINNYNQPLAGRTFRIKLRFLLMGPVSSDHSHQ